MVDYYTGRGTLNAAAVFPNSFGVGMGGLGFQTLLRKLLEYDGCDIRRFFFEDEGGGAHIIASDGGSLKEADIVFVSISYELDYIRFAKMLIDAGIAPRRADRKGLPLIFVGGIAPSVNPLPLFEIADAVHMGECEGVLHSYLRRFEEFLKTLRGPGFIDAREAVLGEWAAMGTAFVPGVTVLDGWTPRWTTYDKFPDDPAHFIHIDESGESVWSESAFLIEASRGCDVGCSFCLVGHNKGTCRNADFNVLTDIIKSKTTASGVGLVGSSVGTYPRLKEIIEFCIGLELRVGLSSLNIRNTSDELLQLLAESGERKVTFAVESASARLQKEIGKIIPSELVIDRVKAAYDAGIKAVKVYFIAGLPGEVQSDIEDSIQLLNDISEQVNLRSMGGKAELDVSVSLFVPKANTPWEGKAMLDMAGLRSRLKMMRDGLAGLPYVSFSSESPEMAIFQGILSVGDEATSGIILSAAHDWRNWRAAFRKASRESGWDKKILEDRG